MAYDETLLTRIRNVLGNLKGIQEKKMFGGICFLFNGNMAFGIHEKNMMVRVGKEKYEEALKEKYAGEMNFTGRPMRGIVTVTSKGIQNDKDLKKWINKGIDFAGTLDPK